MELLKYERLLYFYTLFIYVWFVISSSSVQKVQVSGVVRRYTNNDLSTILNSVAIVFTDLYAASTLSGNSPFSKIANSSG